MKNKIIWLRIGYWVGAAADGLAAVRMLFPQFSDDATYRYAMGLGASLMLGWTFLLIWADRKPLERKFVLLLTAFPVVTGLLVAELFAVHAGIITVGKMLPVGIFLVALIALFSFAYFNALKISSDDSKP